MQKASIVCRIAGLVSTFVMILVLPATGGNAQNAQSLQQNPNQAKGRDQVQQENEVFHVPHPFSVSATVENSVAEVGSQVKVVLHIRNPTNAHISLNIASHDQLILKVTRDRFGDVPKTLGCPPTPSRMWLFYSGTGLASIFKSTELNWTVIANQRYDMSVPGKYEITASLMYVDGYVVTAKPVTVEVREFVDYNGTSTEPIKPGEDAPQASSSP